MHRLFSAKNSDGPVRALYAQTDAFVAYGHEMDPPRAIVEAKQPAMRWFMVHRWDNNRHVFRSEDERLVVYSAEELDGVITSLQREWEASL